MSESEKILTKAEWDREWAPLDTKSEENRKLSLNEYAKKCDRIKKAWKVPFKYSSNGRYYVYLECLLEEGINIPDSILATVDENCNWLGDLPKLDFFRRMLLCS